MAPCCHEVPVRLWGTLAEGQKLCCPVPASNSPPLSILSWLGCWKCPPAAPRGVEQSVSSSHRVRAERDRLGERKREWRDLNLLSSCSIFCCLTFVFLIFLCFPLSVSPTLALFLWIMSMWCVQDRFWIYMICHLHPPPHSSHALAQTHVHHLHM